VTVSDSLSKLISSTNPSRTAFSWLSCPFGPFWSVWTRPSIYCRSSCDEASDANPFVSDSVLRLGIKQIMSCHNIDGSFDTSAKNTLILFTYYFFNSYSS